MTTILEELAAGRIDAAEAARRIDALKAAEATPAPEPVQPEPVQPESVQSEPTFVEPSNEDLAAAGASTDAESDEDAWAATTDRPQQAGVTTESFVRNDPEPESVPPTPEQAKSEQPRSEPTRPKPVNTGGVERISVRAVGRRVRIVGELSVATLSADGPHVLRRNGSVLEVSSDGEMGASLDGFSILRAPRNLEDIRALGLGKELLLRVNPNIVVDVRSPPAASTPSGCRTSARSG